MVFKVCCEAGQDGPWKPSQFDTWLNLIRSRLHSQDAKLIHNYKWPNSHKADSVEIALFVFFSFFSSNHIKDYHESLTGYVSRIFCLSLSLSFCWPIPMSSIPITLINFQKVKSHWLLDSLTFDNWQGPLWAVRYIAYSLNCAIPKYVCSATQVWNTFHFLCLHRHRFTLNTQSNLVLEHFDLIPTFTIQFVNK